MIGNLVHFTTLALAVAGAALFGGPAKAAELDLGAALPDVTAPDQDGKPVQLATAGGKGFTLVYFYPKADTPGCTKQACSLRDAFAQLVTKGVTVYGVSVDGAAAQKAFREKYHLPFTLLADSEKKVIAAFGVPSTMGYASRQAFLFKEGKLVWRDLTASTAEQAQDLLAALEKL